MHALFNLIGQVGLLIQQALAVFAGLQLTASDARADQPDSAIHAATSALSNPLVAAGVLGLLAIGAVYVTLKVFVGTSPNSLFKVVLTGTTLCGAGMLLSEGVFGSRFPTAEGRTLLLYLTGVASFLLFLTTTVRATRTLFLMALWGCICLVCAREAGSVSINATTSTSAPSGRRESGVLAGGQSPLPVPAFELAVSPIRTPGMDNSSPEVLSGDD